eukprot:473482-Prymnesium_polylepis.1
MTTGTRKPGMQSRCSRVDAAGQPHLRQHPDEAGDQSERGLWRESAELRGSCLWGWGGALRRP